MSAINITRTLTFQTIECCSCGTEFAVREDYRTGRINDGASFYCPNGHSNVYKSRIAELEAKLNDAHAQLRASKCETLAEKQLREKAQYQLSRVKNGVCPCCNRSFINLRRHIKSMHPHYSKA